MNEIDELIGNPFLLLIFGVLCSAAIFLISGSGQKRKAGPPQLKACETIQPYVDMLTEQLSLTTEQQARVKHLLEDCCKDKSQDKRSGIIL
jgi:hypothetical protein